MKLKKLALIGAAVIFVISFQNFTKSLQPSVSEFDPFLPAPIKGSLQASRAMKIKETASEGLTTKIKLSNVGNSVSGTVDYAKGLQTLLDAEPIMIPLFVPGAIGPFQAKLVSNAMLSQNILLEYRMKASQGTLVYALDVANLTKVPSAPVLFTSAGGGGAGHNTAHINQK